MEAVSAQSQSKHFHRCCADQTSNYQSCVNRIFYGGPTKKDEMRKQQSEATVGLLATWLEAFIGNGPKITPFVEAMQ